MNDGPPPRPGRNPGLGHIAYTLIGWLAALAIFAIVPVSLVPIDNPGVQSCGTPAAFLLQGRVNTLPDANDHVARAHGRIQTLTKAELNRAYDHPCSKRIARRIAPFAISFAVGSVVGIVLLVCSMVVWWRRAGPTDEDDQAPSDPSAPLPVNSLS